MFRTLALGWMLVGVTVLAGCTANKPLALDSTIEYVDRIVQMGYPVPVTTDRHGRALDVPVDPASPKSVQLLLDWEGADPWIAVTKSNAVFLTAFEKVHRSRDLGRNWTLAKELDRESFPNLQDRDYGWETTMHVDPVTDRLFLYFTARGIYEPTPNLVLCSIYQQVLPLPCDYWSCPSLYYSNDDGGTWTETIQGTNPPPLSCTSPIGSAGVSNHPKITTAPRAGALVPSLADKNPALAYERSLYICDTLYHTFQTLQTTGLWLGDPFPAVPPVPKCSASFDGGNTWERTTVITQDGLDLTAECQIANVGRLAAAPDGTLFVPLYKLDFRFNRRCPPAVAYTTDEGLTWTIRDYEGSPDNATNWENEPSLVLSPDGATAYYFYRAENEGVYMLRSRDRFETWEGPFRVSPADHRMDAYVSAVAGSKGRIGIAYFGTRDWQDDSLRKPHPPRADPNSVWYAFVTTTFDADGDEPTFTTDQATTNQDPVQIGCTGLQLNGPEIPHSILGQLDELLDCPNQLNLQHLTVDQNGRLLFAFTDGCDVRNDCTTDFSSGFQARDRMLALTVQSSGYSLFEEKGELEDLRLEPPRPKPKCEDLCERQP